MLPFNIKPIKQTLAANTKAIIDEANKADAIPWYKTNTFIFGCACALLLLVIILFSTKK